MKNITLNKNLKNKMQEKNKTKEKINNNTIFNKNSHSKKEESKLGQETKEENKSPNLFRLKTSRPKNPYKISYSRNFNDYKQILTELTDINNSKISWAIKLRKELIKDIEENKAKEDNIKKIRNISSAKPVRRGLILTSNFIEPRFYMDDLEKYRKKIKSIKRPLSSLLNPNFNNVKHLFINKTNHQSKEFASSLRNYYTPKSKTDKIKWSNHFTNNYKSKENAYYTKFLLPKTEEGKKNYKKIEKRISTPYSVNYKEIMVGNDTIKQKVLTPKKDFCYSGVGSYLDLGKYRTNYGVKNTGFSINILKAESNSQCLFELGLRNYPKIKVKS